MNASQLDLMTLKGLVPAPAQAMGGVRLVPLIRPHVVGDLRLGLRKYDAYLTAVDLGGRPAAPRTETYTSYVPHGLVVGWTKDGSEVVGETMLDRRVQQRRRHDPRLFQVLHRMVRREQRGPQSRLRMLPLHVAMEAYLSLHFGGPDIAWSDYSQRVLRHGLTPRAEYVLPGRGIAGLDDALRLFEIHDGQCGLLIFVGGSLASATVVSHPDDYRRMHRALVDDFYGIMLAWFGRYHTASAPRVHLEARRVDDWDGLRAELDRARAEWGRFELRQAAGLLGRHITAKQAYAMGPFSLVRFDTGFSEHVENHLGEAIVRDDGTLEYLKTYRLTRGQCRRGFILRHLAAHDWHIGDAAAAVKQTRRQFVERIKQAELRWILHARHRE